MLWCQTKKFLLQFFFDGVVTIASMLDIAVYYLAQNPEMQERAYEEIQV
jgi:cytochrome P450